MAIQKDHVLANGTSGNYWCIDAVSISPQKLECMITINLYKDDTFQPPIAEPITFVNIYLGQDEFVQCVDMVGSKTVTELFMGIYAYLLTKPEWIDGVLVA